MLAVLTARRAVLNPGARLTSRLGSASGRTRAAAPPAQRRDRPPIAPHRRAGAGALPAFARGERPLAPFPHCSEPKAEYDDSR